MATRARSLQGRRDGTPASTGLAALARRGSRALAAASTAAAVRARRELQAARSGADALAALLGAAATSAHRWLTADVRETVRMELVTRSARAPAPGAAELPEDLRTDLHRWASRLRRRRALVVVRRHLIAGLALVIVAEIVTVSLGGERHSPWLLAPLALAALDEAIVLRQAVSLETVAQMLDRRLALHDRVVTALEILRAPQPPAGLRALVVEEARAASAASFATVRLSSRRPAREWLWLAAALIVIVLLATLPGIGGAAARRGTLARAPHAPLSALSRAAPKAAVTLPAGAPAPATLKPGAHLAPAPLTASDGASRTPKETGFSPYGHGGNSLSAKELARQGIAPPSAAGTGGLAALAIGEAGPGKGGGAASAGSHGAAGSGGSGEASSSPRSGSSGAATAGGGTLTPASAQSGSASPAAASKQSSPGTGGAGSGSSPPGGKAAGSAPGSTALTNGLVPLLATGTSGLPLQAGYAPSGAPGSSNAEGISQTPNGGGKGGRAAHVSNGSQGSVSSNLSVIPPTSNSTPALDEGLLSSYFGSANQLVPRGW